MAGKRKQMSSLQKQLAISLFEDGVNQRRIAEILEESQSSVSNFWSDSISVKVVKMKDLIYYV